MKDLSFKPNVLFKNRLIFHDSNKKIAANGKVYKKMSETETQGQKSLSKFTSKQKLIFILCLIAYTCAYLNRVNISISLPGITNDLGLTNLQTGTITSAFFWTYAAGQIISGWLGDRLSPKYMIGIGLAMSSILCFLFSFMNSTLSLSILWALNGLFQSMLWAPIMRIIASNFTGEKLIKATFGISFSLVVGYMISWGTSVLISKMLGWRAIFYIPAVFVALFVVFWFILYKDDEEGVEESLSERKEGGTALRGIKYMPAILTILILVCITHGIVKEGINVWLPTILSQISSFDLESTLGVLLVVPVINFGGILLTKLISDRTKANSYITLVVLFAASVAVALILALTNQISAISMVIFTVLLCGLMFATNPVLTSFIPVSFAQYKCVSTMAGLIDSTIYVGAALSGIFTGLLTTDSDWSGVFWLWFAAMTTGTLLTIILLRLYNKQQKNKTKQ